MMFLLLLLLLLLDTFLGTDGFTVYVWTASAYGDLCACMVDGVCTADLA